jgi:hypothetical protein
MLESLPMLTASMLNLSTRLLLTIALGLLTLSACSNNEHAHTTVVTQIPPPPRQLLTEVSRPPSSSSRLPVDPTADSKKPFLIFTLENGRTVHIGEDVPLDFSVMNAKLKGEGGEFRVRYIVDDDEMKWLDTANQSHCVGGSRANTQFEWNSSVPMAGPTRTATRTS